MVWSHEQKIIFVHIPKTGGTTVENYLDLMKCMQGYCVIKNVGMLHFNWNDYNVAFQHFNWNDYNHSN